MPRPRRGRRACGRHPVEPTAGPHRGEREVHMLDPDGIRVGLVEAATRLEATTRLLQDGA